MADRTLTAALVISASASQANAVLSQVANQINAIAGAGKRAMGILAGAGVAYGGLRFDRESIDSAISMQAEMAHVSTAVNDGAQTVAHLNAVQAKANELMATGINTNVNLAESYYMARSAGLSHAQAMAAMAAGNTIVTATGKTVAEAQGAAVDTTRLLADTFNIFGDKTQDANKQLSTFADLITQIQTGHAFANITELRYAMEYIDPVAHAVGMTLQQSLALAAILSESGLHGATGGVVGAELIKELSTGGKLAGFRRADPFGNLDVGKSLQAINAVTSHMLPNIRARFLKAMGFEGENLVGIELTLSKWGEFNGIVAEGMNSQGVAAAKAAERTAAMDFQIQILLNRWSRFKEIIGESLLGPLNSVLGYLKPVVLAMDAFAETHAGIAQLAAAVIGVGSAAIIAGGAFQLLGIGATVSAIATGAWTAATWLLNTALLANPFGLAILGIAALVVAIDEIVKHWTTIKTFFVTVGADMYAAGKNLMTMLAHGMIDMALAPVHAAEDIAHRIGRFFVGHSPIPEGALHDMDLGREIAASMKPGPVVAAVRQLAAAAALAIPLSISPAMGAVAPALAARAPGGELTMHGAGSSGHVTNNINIGSPRITVNGGTGKPAEIETAVLSAMRTHTHELATELQRHKFNRDRGNY